MIIPMLEMDPKLPQNIAVSLAIYIILLSVFLVTMWYLFVLLFTLNHSFHFCLRSKLALCIPL
jgi:hypothetical protein